MNYSTSKSIADNCYITTATGTTNNYITTSSGTTPTHYTIKVPLTVDPNDAFNQLMVKLNPQQIDFKIKATIVDNDEIVDIVEYVPQKVYKIVFGDKTEIKTICDDLDLFSAEYMLYLALAKKLYSKTHTFEGIISKSYTLSYEKRYAKIVKKGLKLFNKLQEEMRKKEEYDKIKKRKYEKLVRKKKAAKERKRNEQINIIAEAIRLSKEEG